MKPLISSVVLSLVLSSGLASAEDKQSIYQGVDGIVTVSPDPISLAGFRAIEQIKIELYERLDLIGQIEQSRDFNLNFPHQFVTATIESEPVAEREVSAE